ncbi:MAG: hypothetical protein JST87_05415 [Bacteroidetes bacterium]|nr:hypothetical protein [Bacteroidota bacterium]
MAKRFTDTEKWVKNKWFRKLSKDEKLFWLFILDACDSVGVWEEDVEFVCELLDLELSIEKLKEKFESQIKIFRDGKKWWIKNFCFYQYGILKEENLKNKPHQKYISELKKHRLWIDYTKTIHSLEEKEEDKEKEKEEDFGKSENLSAKKESIVYQLEEIFISENKNYTKHETDYPAYRKFAEFICQQAGIKPNFNNLSENDLNLIKQKFRTYAQIIASTPHMVSKSLSDLVKFKIQEIANIEKNGIKTYGTSSKQNSQRHSGKSAGAYELINEIKEDAGITT